MQRALYTLLLRLALPVQALRYCWRGWRSPEYRGSLRAHLAWEPTPRMDHPLWLHAASVGEVQAMAPLVHLLREEFPALPIVMTVGTATGLARARQSFSYLLTVRAEVSPALTLMASPWDLPGAVQRFIGSQRPRAAVFIETELWPNLLHQASRLRVPLLLASARVSARSAQRYRSFAAGLMRDTVRAFALIGAQTPVDRERFIALGADPRAVECWGNLKFDLTPPPGTVEKGRSLRMALAADRPLWLAGSTHAGEEDACLSAHRSLQDEARARGDPTPLLVIAPRRPERFEDVARLIAARGFVMGRHSQVFRERVDVLLVDRLGELLPYYAAADVAFVGGSLVPVGGHNLVEPAALGKPVLAGPHTRNAPDVAWQLEAAGGLMRVSDASSLASAVGALLQDPARARRMGEAAVAVVVASGGATTRALHAITAVLRARQAAPAADGPTAGAPTRP